MDFVKNKASVRTKSRINIGDKVDETDYLLSLLQIRIPIEIIGKLKNKQVISKQINHLEP